MHLLRPLISLLLALPLAAAHMSMEEPPALRYKTNPFKTVQDYDYNSPLAADGSNFPCKGYHKDLGTAGGKPVRSYAAGGTYTLKLAGTATHAGGSCQLSLSYDKGKTFEVFKSFIGGCVKPDPNGDQSFQFTIPRGAPSGKEVIFAWSWFNNLGNREMYMNCAVVSITGGGKKNAPVCGGKECIGKREQANPTDNENDELREEMGSSLRKRSFGGVPLFKANIGNGCIAPAGKDLVFPQPGSTIEYGGNKQNQASPLGDCGPGNYIGGGGGVGNPGDGCEYYREQGYSCNDGGRVFGGERRWWSWTASGIVGALVAGVRL